ncbi:Rv2175c family DNA-binding protein [Nostocoides sp. F2B08]|uniref:Rv2175c family DNA-binding protein n=1 Tax=Nostocoides sp. F2B08 TaxID=2653936 RepID=UPI001D040592|nr:Rv2175c family DNA-binding protein [Tetrasphaera sp. F2B08]
MTTSGIVHASPELMTLVPSWLSVPEVAERVGLPMSLVRRMIDDRDVLAARVGENNAVAVPEAFLGPDGPLHSLKGTFTVLADGGLDDLEILVWLFTPDPSLPAPGAPIDNLHAGFKTEIRRRAMELAL